MRKIGLLGLLVSFAIGSAAVAADPPNPQAQPAGVQERVNPGMQAQTGKFVDRGGRVFNVQAYGAVVDGRKDVSASFAAAFADGAVTPATFAPSRIQDPALRPLIKKLTVVEEPEFTRRYPAEACTRVEVTTTDGRQVVAETSHPKGHRRNPLTDGEVELKFRGLASEALGAKGCDRVLAEVWNLEKATTLNGLFKSLQRAPTM